MGWTHRIFRYSNRLSVERERRIATERLLESERQFRLTLERQLSPSKNQKGTLVIQPAELVALLTLTGLALFGIALITYRAFYDQFGMEPEEAGLGYLQILAQAALGAAAFAASIAIPIAIIMVISKMSPIENFGRSAQIENFERSAQVVLGMYVFMAAVLFGFVSDLTGVNISTARIALLIVLASMPLLWWKRFRRSKLHIALGALLVFSLLVIPHSIGRQLADKVRLGEPTSTAATGRFLRIPAKRVEAFWNVSGTLRPFEQELMFLGQADGTVHLYDLEAHAVYRIPAESVVLRSLNSIKT